MENYSKGKNVEEPLELNLIPIPNLPKDVLWMQVRGGSKVRDLLDVALDAYNRDSKDVLWTGSGPAVGKAITCAEILKRRYKGVHQFNYICYRRCEEYWDPKLEGLDPLVVNRDVPMIHILLSHNPINEGLPGYQVPQGEGRPNRQPKHKPKPVPKPGNYKEMEKFGLRFDKKKKSKDFPPPKTEGE